MTTTTRHDLITHETNSGGILAMCSCTWRGVVEPVPVHEVSTKTGALKRERHPEVAKQRAYEQWNEHTRRATEAERAARTAPAQ